MGCAWSPCWRGPAVVLSRSQLEDKLYGWKDEVSSNAVEVYIHGLRKKLGAELIQNVRGVGYMVPPRMMPCLNACAIPCGPGCWACLLLAIRVGSAVAGRRGVPTGAGRRPTAFSTTTWSRWRRPCVPGWPCRACPRWSDELHRRQAGGFCGAGVEHRWFEVFRSRDGWALPQRAVLGFSEVRVRQHAVPRVFHADPLAGDPDRAGHAARAAPWRAVLAWRTVLPIALDGAAVDAGGLVGGECLAADRWRGCGRRWRRAQPTTSASVTEEGLAR